MVKPSKIYLCLWVALLFCIAPPAISAESNFVTLKLPRGVQIDAPRGWWVLNDTMNRLIATSAEAALDLSGLEVQSQSNVLFAANSMPPSTYASMRVSLDTSTPNTPQELTEFQNASEDDIVYLAAEMQAYLRQALAPQGLEFLATLGAAKEQYGKFPALSYRYRRTGPNGPVIVDLIQVFRDDGIISVNLAYRESEAGLWKVIVARIKKSITIY